jgi:hypothetical protein
LCRELKTGRGEGLDLLLLLLLLHRFAAFFGCIEYEFSGGGGLGLALGWDAERKAARDRSLLRLHVLRLGGLRAKLESRRRGHGLVDLRDKAGGGLGRLRALDFGGGARYTEAEAAQAVALGRGGGGRGGGGRGDVAGLVDAKHEARGIRGHVDLELKLRLGARGCRGTGFRALAGDALLGLGFVLDHTARARPGALGLFEHVAEAGGLGRGSGAWTLAGDALVGLGLVLDHACVAGPGTLGLLELVAEAAGGGSADGHRCHGLGGALRADVDTAGLGGVTARAGADAVEVAHHAAGAFPGVLGRLRCDGDSRGHRADARGAAAPFCLLARRARATEYCTRRVEGGRTGGAGGYLIRSFGVEILRQLLSEHRTRFRRIWKADNISLAQCFIKDKAKQIRNCLRDHNHACLQIQMITMALFASTIPGIIPLSY